MPLNKKNLLKALEEINNSKKKRGFKQSLELIVKLQNLDLKKTDNRINETVELPHGLGMPSKICFMGSGDLATKAREAKAELVMSRQDLEGMAGDKKEVKKLANAYDYFIAEAPLMPVVGKTLGQSLGPRGKMPTPITPGSSIGELIDKHRKMIRIRVRDNPIVQCKVGTEDMPIDQIADNIEAVISRLEGKLERGNKNIASVFLKYTMSNPVKLTL